MLLKAEAFYSLHRLPETSFYSSLFEEIHRILHILHPRIPQTQKDNSTTRSLQFQSSIHPAVHIHVYYKTFQRHHSGSSVSRHSSHSSVSRTSRVLPHSSILPLECIFYTLAGFHRKLHRVPVENFKLQEELSSKKGRCCIISQIDTSGKIELIPSSVLSSESANYKNDIQ